MKRLLFVAGRSGPSLDYALPRLAATASVHAVLLSPVDDFALGELGRHCADVTDRSSAADPVTALTEHARRIGADGLLTFSEYAVRPVAEACVRLGLPGPGVNAARARDKWLMRLRWQRAGVPVPRFRHVTSLGDLQRARDRIALPFLLKRADGAGSIGHVVIGEDTDIAEVWHRALEVDRAARGDGFGDYTAGTDVPSFVAEELIESTTESWYDESRDDTRGYGDYLSVEGIVAAGTYHPVCVTGRLPTVAPFTELSNQAPCVLPERLQRIVEEHARRAVDSLGLDTCATHTELKLMAGNRLSLLETAARVGGAMVTREVAEVYGVDLITLQAREALSEPQKYPDRMLVTGEGRAAASLALIATDSRGTPWATLPRLNWRTHDWGSLVSPGTTVEIARGSTVPDGTVMPRYDAAAAALSIGGIAYLTADDPATLKADTYRILDGLEASLVAGEGERQRAELTGSAPVVYADELPAAAEVSDLFRAAELNGPIDEPARMRRMLETSQHLMTARVAGRLVGLIRVLTDLSFNAFVADLAVHPDLQRRGIGGELLRRATEPHPGVKFVVHPGNHSGDFYRKQGFVPAPECVALPRRESDPEEDR
ncbi:GNAT family N-acetyltransferase [Streptomyces kanamyceticus]|uniref:GNAT family N-acetyltransferase n=1 Tax=Streptomyces kanamyceticus TaxID=1967 RepID=A0A5J6G9B3_STRKN|nr:GNAT family N-acetyltransferase [Streptomyces kanamyceticus]QEU90391.1 GNAT family N-acetyltransferase [Streptomyces kanamyceticus]